MTVVLVMLRRGEGGSCITLWAGSFQGSFWLWWASFSGQAFPLLGTASLLGGSGMGKTWSYEPARWDLGHLIRERLTTLRNGLQIKFNSHLRLFPPSLPGFLITFQTPPVRFPTVDPPCAFQPPGFTQELENLSLCLKGFPGQLLRLPKS